MSQTFPKVIYICGPDGAGKSFLCEALAEKLKGQGKEVEIKWLRFSHYLTRIPNAIGRLFGLSYRETYEDGEVIGYHDYHKSWFLKYLFIFCTCVDTVIAGVLRVTLPTASSNKILILDRFVFDVIIDMIIDTKDARIMSGLASRILKTLLPKESVSIAIGIDYETAVSRREALKWDRTLRERIELYKQLPECCPQVKLVDNTGRPEDTLTRLYSILGLVE